jgi:hypothetical protein
MRNWKGKPMAEVKERCEDDGTFNVIIICTEESTKASRRTNICVYCYGSSFEGGIGASAVLYENQRETTSLRFHLGRVTQHTVYELEVVGILLAIYLLSKCIRPLTQRITIGTDSQAANTGAPQPEVSPRPVPARACPQSTRGAAQEAGRDRSTRQGRKIKKRSKNTIAMGPGTCRVWPK